MKRFWEKYRHALVLAALALGLGLVFGWLSVSALRDAEGRCEKVILQDESDSTVPLPEGAVLRQKLTLTQDCYGFLLAFDTGQRILQGTVEVALWEPDGALLASAELQAAELLDRTVATALFADGVAVDGQRPVVLTVAGHPQTEADTLAVLATALEEPSIGALSCAADGAEQALPGSLYLQQLTAYSGAHGALRLYFGLFAAVCALLLLGGYLLAAVFKARLPGLCFFVVFAGGLALQLVVPAPCGTDEIKHIHAAYVYTAQLFGDPIERDKQNLVRSADAWMPDDAAELSAFTYQQWVEDWEWTTDEVGLTGVDRKLYTTDPMARVKYLPAMAAMIFSRLVDLAWLPTLALARLLTLLLHAGLAALTVAAAPPFAKKLFLVVNALPMSVQLYATVNDDAILQLWIFLLFAQILALAAHGERRPPLWRWGALLAGMGVLCVLKTSYVPMAAVLLLVPIRQYRTLGSYLPAAWQAPEKKRLRQGLLAAGCAAAGVAVLLVGVLLLQRYVIPSLQAPEIPLETQAAQADNIYVLPEYTLYYALTHVVDTVRLLLNTVQQNTEYYLRQMLGGYLSEPILVDLELSGLCLLGWAALLGAALVGPERMQRPTPWQRLVCVGSFAVMTLITVMGCYLWTPYGSTTIWGLQGRYLLPALPALLWALSPDRLQLRPAAEADEAAPARRTAFGCCAGLCWSMVEAFVVVLGL